jgi:hypothetical protein
MSRTGRTLTKVFHVETRQHDLFDIDLGDGVPRRMLIAGCVMVVAWCAGLWALIGAPTAQTSTLYLMPPVLLVYFGFQEAPDQPRRRRLTQWAVKGNYMANGHRPIIRMGARSAYRSELISLRYRTRRLLAFAAHYFPQLRDLLDEDVTSTSSVGNLRAGRPIILASTVMLYGSDYTQVLQQEKS